MRTVTSQRQKEPGLVAYGMGILFRVRQRDLFLFSFLPLLLASPLKTALFCRARGTAQSLERGDFSADLSTIFGKQIPSRTLHENRSGNAPDTSNFLRLETRYVRASQAQRESGVNFSSGKCKSVSRCSLGCVARSSYNRKG